VVRERWQELLELTYATRRVTQAEIEPGVNAVVAAPSGPAADESGTLEMDARSAFCQVPEMARGFRLRFDKIRQYGLQLEDGYARWLGRFGPDITSGRTNVVVFVDLAFLEASLIDHLYQSDVMVDFRAPLAFFHRGGLVDGVNVLEAAALMTFEGRSLKDTAGRQARETLAHLESYAAAFWKLSRLHADFRWRIERDNFVLEVPGKNQTRSFHYWELRGSESRALEAWQWQIESLRREAPPLARSGPKSHAA
jgi:hypothetical protein